MVGTLTRYRAIKTFHNEFPSNLYCGETNQYHHRHAPTLFLCEQRCLPLLLLFLLLLLFFFLDLLWLCDLVMLGKTMIFYFMACLSFGITGIKMLLCQINHAIMVFPWGWIIVKGICLEVLQSCEEEPGMCLHRLPSECQSLCHPAALSCPPAPHWHCAGEGRQGLYKVLDLQMVWVSGGGLGWGQVPHFESCCTVQGDCPAQAFTEGSTTCARLSACGRLKKSHNWFSSTRPPHPCWALWL